MDALCIEKLPEALFAEIVILVEGITEQAIIDACGERDGAPLTVDGIVVVEVGGKGGLMLPHAILTRLGIPCYLIFDGDRGSGERRRRNAPRDADQVKLEEEAHQIR